MERIAEDFCEKHSLILDGYLGSGDFGEAYLTECGKVVKITSNESEFVIAHSLVGKENEFTVDVHMVDIVDSNYVILQELLDTEGVEDVYYEIDSIMSETGLTIEEIDPDDFEELSEEAIKMINDISSSAFEYRKAGFSPEDISPYNMGIKTNGNYGLFDQCIKSYDVSRELDDIIEEINQRNEEARLSKMVWKDDVESAADTFCEKYGLEIDKYLGAGSFGKAFLTTCGRVVKVTTNESEFVLAHSLLGKENDFTADIYEVDIVGSLPAILMEYVDTTGIEDLYYSIDDIMYDTNLKIPEIDPKEYGMDDDSERLLKNLQLSIKEYKEKTGFTPEDISEDNIGLKSNGNYCLFDQYVESQDLSQEYKMVVESINKRNEARKINANNPQSVLNTLKTIKSRWNPTNTTLENKETRPKLLRISI